MAPARNTGPPDFIGVGTQRSGTTWWFRLLVNHPDIRPPRGRRKEQHIFDKFGARELRHEDLAAYHDIFPRKPGQLAGEWTPRYMRDPWTPPLLRRAAPDAKLLVLFRDPIERYRSGIPHRLGRHPERRMEALAVDAADRGRYAMQLERLRAHFPPEQILVLQYEKCREDAPGEYARTLRFLGVRDDHRPEDFDRTRGTSTAPTKQPLLPHIVGSLRTLLTPDVLRLRELVPDLDLGLWPHFADL